MDRKRNYAYDPMGNRKTSSVWGGEPVAEDVTTYTANNVNQYTATANPSESFTYDFDGNLTSDGERSYAWDDENRLFWVAPKTPTIGDVAWEYEYDYLGRRVRKYSYLWDPNMNGGYGGWPIWPIEPIEDYRYVYDDWNVVLELDDSNQVLRKYIWGLDLSGSLHAAGGIGGLLSITDANATPATSTDDVDYIYFYDANGNVGQLLDWQDSLGDPVPTIVAKYEYDPNGNALLDPANASTSGPYAATNPFRFSTKYLDPESGQHYYGHRFLDPPLGRWTSRDPIEEKGGVNLLEFTKNNPLLYFDPLGKESCKCGPEIGPAITSHLNKFVSQPAGGLWFNWLLEYNTFQPFARGNGALLWNASYFAPGATKCGTGRCTGTVSLCGLCISGYYIDHILIMSYLENSYGSRAARYGGQANESVFLALVNSGLIAQGHWDVVINADLHFNEIAICIAEQMRHAQDSGGVTDTLTRGELCQCVLSIPPSHPAIISKKPNRQNGKIGYLGCSKCGVEVPAIELALPPIDP